MSPAPKFSSQEQLAMILAAAAKCIAQTSLLDFTMSAISKEAGLSMGSIYKHIQSKEDVLVALATQMYQNLHCVFEQVMALPLPYVQRLIAIQLLGMDKVCLYEFDDHLEMLVANEAVLKRASPQWIEKMVQADSAIEAQCGNNIRQALHAGELALEEGQDAQSLEELIKVGAWSLHVGFMQVARQRYARNLVGQGIDMPFPLQVKDAIVQAQKRLLNTYPWREKLRDEDIVNLCQMMAQQGLR